MSVDYVEFIAAKAYSHIDAGFTVGKDDMPWSLRDFQQDAVAWACRRGRAALFADTGLGKTIMQLAWAALVEQETNKPVLVVTPLCVAQQTVREGAKFGIECKYIREPQFCNPRIHVTNYEMLKNFNPDDYAGIVLDESSILKGMDGRMRKYITEFGSTIPYRLSCTATPSPNDFMELGTQSEFLGIMSQVEMLAMFFIHDGNDTAKWRLKGHGRRKFWEWLSTWALVIRNPADLGYDGAGYDLPPLNYKNHVVETGVSDGLFVKIAQGLQERNQARRESIDLRVEKAAEIANSVDGHCLVWCHLNEESEKFAKLTGACEVTGSMTAEEKEISMLWFLGYDDLELIGNRVKRCQTVNTSKTTTRGIEKKGNSSQQSGRQITQKNANNTCENIEKETRKSGSPQKKKGSEKMLSEGRSTRKMRSTEKSRNPQSNHSTRRTQKSGSINDSKNMVLTQTSTEKYSRRSAEGVQFVESSIQGASNKKDCTLITATKTGKSEGYFAPTATRPLENSRIMQGCSERPPNTSRKLMVSKPRIFGYGLNLQHCNNMVFVGLSDSWESFYQAVRRCWRFGQDKPVTVHIVTADTEGAVLANIRRKQKQNEQMAREMADIMHDFTIAEIKGASVEKTDYIPIEPIKLPKWGSQ